MNAVPALQLEAVSKTFGAGEQEVHALEHVDLTVAADEIVALVGPSGSGKTTLCSIAGGILSATSGQVVVGGQDITGFKRTAAQRASGASTSASSSRP